MISISLMILVSMVAIPVITLACLLSDSISVAPQEARVPVKTNSNHQ